ncbi:hypothetical protein ASD50_11860 [Mesorhizobium sp. Root552]|nr:hypothetical protein ASD50_11860 [Mesorhizobium sp. Root552]
MRTTGRDEISEDDPFAELTRIMGFDPRVPVNQQNASAQADGADDFAIDLEKELMGEFGEADEAVASAHIDSADPRYGTDGGAEAAADDDAAAVLDQDFEFDDDLVLDDAELSGEAVPASEQVRATVDDEDAGSFELQSDNRVYDDEADEVSGDFDRVDFELTEAGEVPSSGASADDFEADFDMAMADVDMDFDERPAEAGVVSGQEFESSEFEEEAVADEPSAPIAEAEEEIPFDAVTQEEASPSGEPAGEPAAARGESLEDELNALLNQMSARPLPVQHHEDVAPVEHSAAADTDWSPAEEPVAVEVAVEPESVEYSVSDDQDADLLEELEAQDVVAVDASDAAEFVAAAEHEADGAAEIEFDHSDVEAAMAGEDEVEQAEAQDLAAEQPAPAAEDPIEALKWLAAAAPVAGAAASGRIWSRGTPYLQPETAPAQPIASAEPVESQAFSSSQPEYEIPAAYDVSFDSADLSEATDAVAEAEAYEAAEAIEVAPAAPAYDEVPDVETVDVPERVVALADDLDIPDVPFESENADKPIYDDLEAEFTSLLTEMNAHETASVATQPAVYASEAYKPDYKQAETGASAYAKPQQAQAAPVGNDYDDPTLAGFDIDDLPGSKPLEGQNALGDDDLAFDPDFDDDMSLPDPAETAAAPQPRRRAVMIAALVGAVALIGGIGAFALSFGGDGGSSAPVLVKADDNPIKVKPENPGGTVVPNQDNKVYDMVAKGSKPAAPQQDKLVTDAEEPVDVTAKAPEARIVEPAAAVDDVAAAQPSGKSEDRIAPAAVQADTTDQSEVALVTPRKVRTMIVKPDGSLVPREEPQPAAAQVAATEPVDPAPQLVVNPTTDDQTGAVSPSTETQAGQAPAASEPAPAVAATQPQAPQPAAQSAVTPALAPVAPQRPAEQPVDIVGEVKPDQVAAVDPAGGAAAPGSWSMQIASQPSVESAQSTYQDLARRYSSVLEGRSVNIVKAEVAGKGTFYRVRVAANSRNEAISLCENYKAAGGNCFVSK